jgi:hypothetical protein
MLCVLIAVIISFGHEPLPSEPAEESLDSPSALG